MSGTKKYNVVIGLPAKNEEAGIYESLLSIGDAVKYAKISNYQIAVCINGCIDNTAKQVRRFIKENHGINCILTRSRPGLVNAQRKIVESFPAEIYVFPDADGKISLKSIKLLLNELRRHPDLIVAYARTLSLAQSIKKIGLAEKIGLLYDSQKLLTPREYFHGRFFAIRDWRVPENKDIRKIALSSMRNRELLKYCTKDILLSADDVFMSSYIMDHYGLRAIKQVNSAYCYSWPISSFRDWFNVYRRRNIEMEKMRRWFPEYNYLWPHLNRRTDWHKWQQADLNNKFVWIGYLLMKGIFYCFLKVEFKLLRFGFFMPAKQWKPASSTKKRARKIIFFDIDDTLITEEPIGMKKLKRIIALLKLQGDVFGINTNRPWTQAKKIYSVLDLNGPAICEGGAYYKVDYHAGEKRLPHIDVDMKDRIIKFINYAYGQKGIGIFVSDNKKLMADKKSGQLIFITAARKYSISIYARNHGLCDHKFARFLYRMLKLEFSDLPICLLSAAGKITIDNPGVDKCAAISYVMKRNYGGQRACLISNDEIIGRNWPNIGFYGIMNASKRYKKKCSFIADKPGEDGLIQIINNCV